jgi:ABC-type dipeptide/oligopeptide/nickel transport system ATPase component
MFDFKDVKYKIIINISKLTIETQKVTFIVGESGSGKQHFYGCSIS